MTLKFYPTRRRWVLNFTENGRQRRLSFHSKQAAKEHWQGRPNLGAFWLGLDDGERAQIIAAWQRCKDHSLSLLDCVVGANEKSKSITPIEALEQFIKDKKKIGLRKRSLTDLSTSLGNFCSKVEVDVMDKIKTAHIETFLDSRKIGPKRFNVIRGNIINFFNWALSSSFVNSNPALSVKRAIEDDAPIKVLKPEQANELLSTAIKIDARTIPYFTLGLFCGIRPAEAMALSWSDINFERRTVHVSPNKSKTRQNRYVSLPDNAINWLKLGGELPCSFLPCRFKRFIRPRLSFKWSQDVMRHSFASYHLALHKNEASTCYEMGDNSTTLFKHYRKLVTSEIAIKYFSIRAPI